MSQKTDGGVDSRAEGPIVCATRGGEVSRRTQQRAIDLARERDAAIIFFFVVDVHFADNLNPDLQAALVEEMSHLGRTLLRIACYRAQRSGVSARTCVRQGTVAETLQSYLIEVGASTLVMGTPRPESDQHSFQPEEVPVFALKIEAETCVEVVIVH
jgi:nucleotide-binding universal stress UspA family protein